MEKNQLKKAKHILCIRLDNMGDVLMTSPAFRALKDSLPECRITLLTSNMGSGIAKYIPEIDDVIEFNAPWVKAGLENNALYVENFIKKLKEFTFDAVIIFTTYSQNPLPTAMLAYLAQIPIRVGYCRENPYELLNYWVPDTEPLYEIKHEVERQLDLLKVFGITTSNEKLSLEVPKIDRTIDSILIDIGIDPDKPWIVLHPSVSESKRQYPSHLYVEASKKLIQKGFQIILTGVNSEARLTDSMRSKIGNGAYAAAGIFNMAEYINLIAQSKLLISNNTGPAHIAAAVGTPVVVLYAQTNPQHTPWKVKSKILYFGVPKEKRSKNILLSYNYPKNIADMVHPDEIVQAAENLFS